jgi:hypothetical protein
MRGINAKVGSIGEIALKFWTCERKKECNCVASVDVCVPCNVGEWVGTCKSDIPSTV